MTCCTIAGEDLLAQKSRKASGPRALQPFDLMGQLGLDEHSKRIGMAPNKSGSEEPSPSTVLLHRDPHLDRGGTQANCRRGQHVAHSPLLACPLTSGAEHRVLAPGRNGSPMETDEARPPPKRPGLSQRLGFLTAPDRRSVWSSAERRTSCRPATEHRHMSASPSEP